MHEFNSSLMHVVVYTNKFVIKIRKESTLLIQKSPIFFLFHILSLYLLADSNFFLNASIHLGDWMGVSNLQDAIAHIPFYCTSVGGLLGGHIGWFELQLEHFARLVYPWKTFILYDLVLFVALVDFYLT